MLVAEGDVPIHEIADRLHTPPTRRRLVEQLPGDLRQPIGFAVAATEKVEQRIRGKLLHRGLARPGHDHVRQTRIVNQRIGGQPHLPAGATMREHQLPKVSRYTEIGTDGLAMR